MTGFGSFSQCIVDGDAETLARARHRRGKALAASMALQAIVVAVMFLWPLIAIPGALPPRVVLVPVAPYRGGGATMTRPHHVSARPEQALLPNQLIFPTARAAKPAHELSMEPAPDIGVDLGSGFGPANGNGPGGSIIPGGSDNGAAVPALRRPVAPRPLIRKVSEGVMLGALVYRVDPPYPGIARAMHLSGTVRLRAIIGTDGSVRNLEVLSGSPILARAAVAAVRQWRYRPTRLSGTAVEVETLVTVKFVLGN